MSDIEEKIETAPGENSENTPILHIDNFDGPLDLLWELIKKAKIDITEITISHITEQYLAYLKLMEKLNVRVATDFIRMASELLFYKSCALLPAGQIDDEYFIPPLPPELVQKLLEFKMFQNASRRLLDEFATSSNRYARENKLDDIIEMDDFGEVSLFDLLKAFAGVIESQKAMEEEEIVFDEILVGDRIEYIKSIMMKRDVIHFPEIFSAKPSRMEVVVTFMALLELARTKIVRLLQQKIYGLICIVRNSATTI
jgi:segregation and condensation protein A